MLPYAEPGAAKIIAQDSAVIIDADIKMVKLVIQQGQLLLFVHIFPGGFIDQDFAIFPACRAVPQVDDSGEPGCFLTMMSDRISDRVTVLIDSGKREQITNFKFGFQEWLMGVVFGQDF